MDNLTSHLANLRRPGLLIHAARLASGGAQAKRHAKRRGAQALLAEEEVLNAARLGGGLGYSPCRHVEVIGALLCAARGGR
jgi:hypothetical protein